MVESMEVDLSTTNETEEQQNARAQEELREYEAMTKSKIETTGEVSKKDFTLLQVIGKGSYGKVYLV